jgi:hypothetical protein
MPFNRIEDCPDIFVYLLQLGKEVSFKRLPAAELFGKTIQNSTDRVISLANNRGHGSNKDDDAGVIKIFVGVYNETNNIKREPFESDIGRSYVGEGKLFVNLYQGKSILSGDEDGSSDPFVKAIFYGSAKESKVIEDTLNPIWYQRLELPAKIFQKEIPPIILKVYD